MPWLYYDKTSPDQTACPRLFTHNTNNSLASDSEGVIWSDVDNDWLAVDVTQNPPVVIQLAPPPEPSPPPGG